MVSKSARTPSRVPITSETTPEAPSAHPEIIIDLSGVSRGLKKYLTIFIPMACVHPHFRDEYDVQGKLERIRAAEIIYTCDAHGITVLFPKPDQLQGLDRDRRRWIMKPLAQAGILLDGVDLKIYELLEQATEKQQRGAAANVPDNGTSRVAAEPGRNNVHGVPPQRKKPSRPKSRRKEPTTRARFDALFKGI